MIVTCEANFVRNVASSKAVSPPPTTATDLPLKKNPSQVAQLETPCPRSLVSDSNPSHWAEAPVAMMRASDVNSSSATQTLNGRVETSTFVAFFRSNVAPNFSACPKKRCIRSGPKIEGNPG